VPDFDSSNGAFAVATRREGDVALILLSGELDISAAEELDTAIRDAEETDIGQIVVDLSAINFVDSTGLSVLLYAKRRIDGRLHVTPSDHDAVTRLLELTGTTEILSS
jgi:anti-sigma B factor antagonist